MAENSRPGSRFSRRGFMRTGLGVGTALLLPNLPGVRAVGSAAAAHDHEPVGRDEEWKDFKPGAPFVEPEVRRSANGELNTTLRMQYAYKDIGGHRLYVRTYEGAVPGTDPAPEAGRRAAHQAHQRHASQPRSHADRPFAAASVQHHQFSLPWIACQSERHLRQCHAHDGAGRELRHRDRHTFRPYPWDQLVSPARPWFGRRTARERRGWAR